MDASTLFTQKGTGAQVKTMFFAPRVSLTFLQSYIAGAINLCPKSKR